VEIADGLIGKLPAFERGGAMRLSLLDQGEEFIVVHAVAS